MVQSLTAADVVLATNTGESVALLPHGLGQSLRQLLSFLGLWAGICCV